MAILGVNYRDAGRLPEAAKLLGKALDKARERPGGLPAQLAWVPAALAATHDAGGQFAKAEPLYRSFLEQAQKQFGAGDLRTSAAQAQLGLNLLQQKKYTDAESLLRDCLKVRQQKQPDAWTTFNTQSMLGGALLGQKKYTEAEPLLLEGYQGMKQRQDKIPLAGRPRLLEALERLVQLYEALDQPDQADQWRKKLQEQKQQKE
jgi:hypothetical protein